MFEDQTKEVILDRSLSRIDERLDKRQGSIVWDMLSPFTIEMAMAYIELNNVLNFGFADTTSDEYLERRAKEVGLTRKSAVPAIGNVTFSGEPGTILPPGIIVTTDDEENPIAFETLAGGTILDDGILVVPAKAVVGGTSGNVFAGAISIVTGDLSGLITVTNEAAFTGGIDRESDADLLLRYYGRMQNMSASGSIADYTRWALEITNIGSVRIFPLWNGPGTVKVVLLTSNRRTPSASLVQEVREHIEERRPVCANVTVVGATEVPIDVSVTVTLNPGATLQQARAQIDAAITSYFRSLAFSDRTVRYTKIVDCVAHAAAVLDYSNLKVNGATANIVVADDAIAYLGSIAITSSTGGSSGGGSGGGDVGTQDPTTPI